MAPYNFETLTYKQKLIYSAIESYIKINKIPPTVREIGEMVGEKSPGAVQGILNRLEKKGVIKRQGGMARSIQLVSQEGNLYAEPLYIPEIKKISQRQINDLLNVYNIVKYQPFPSDLVNCAEKCYIIKCPDDSLYESGIKYGDILLVDMGSKPKDGDIVLVLYGNRVLVRYYYTNTNSKEGSITLKADTNLLDKERFDADEVQIAGKVIGKYMRL